jgi:flagellar biosynthesis protein FlhG
MKNPSEWLVSFNSNYQSQIQALVSERKLVQEKTTTISITGGKGGVGKTSVSLKLAKELSNQGAKVLLIDCDYNLSNTAIKLGLPITNTFYSLVSSEKTFEECLHVNGNFHLLSACNGSIDLFDTSFKMEEIIIDIINEHEKEYDYILLDCPAGLMRETLTLNAYCDKRVIVVTPDRASITDSYSLMKVLSHKFGIKENHLLVNMYTTTSQFEKVVKTLSETVENFLGCRTQILGGVKKLDIPQSKFDKYFIEPGKNIHHKNFLQVVNKLTDELSTSVIREAHLASKSMKSFEQEVL